MSILSPQKISQLLPILQAYAEGKTIQMLNAEGLWEQHLGYDFSFTPSDYRIKPEPIEVKYRLALHSTLNNVYHITAHIPKNYELVDSWIKEKLFGYIKWMDDEQTTFIDSE